LSTAVKDEICGFSRGSTTYPGGTEMKNALVATAARTRCPHFDEKI
jgi:hypothetical protein